jgi:uncharacterized protein (TIGR03083 family)
VRGLVVHLVGVERYGLGQLGVAVRIDAPRRADHVPATVAAAADVSALPGPELRTVWKATADRVGRRLAAIEPDAALTLHHIPLGPTGMAVIRTFELWTHADDIRRATGRTLSSLDEDRLALMSSALMDALPGALLLEDALRPGRTAEIVLTGRGGSRRLVPMGLEDQPGEPDVSITVDVLALCRFAANRVDADDLGLEVVGDESLVAPFLVAAGAFATD